MNFKLFLEKVEFYKSDLKTLLRSIPKNHAKLIKGYKINFESENTLKNDSDHIGFIDEKNKTIRIAAPWNYSRSFTFLHEIAHAVWKYILDKDQKKEWSELIRSTKKDQKKKLKKEIKDCLDQDDEELFCMTYATKYSRHQVNTYYNKNWIDFIEKI